MGITTATTMVVVLVPELLLALPVESCCELDGGGVAVGLLVVDEAGVVGVVSSTLTIAQNFVVSSVTSSSPRRPTKVCPAELG